MLQCDKKEGGWDGNYDQEDSYDVKDDYDDDDKCTVDEREECCTANEKKQLQVCENLGCNIRKVSTAQTNTSPQSLSRFVYLKTN